MNLLRRPSAFSNLRLPEGAQPVQSLGGRLPGLGSRKVLVVPLAFIVLMTVLPWITDFIEHGRGPRQARELGSEIIGTGVALVLGAWIIYLIRREQLAAARHLAELERLTLTDPLTGLGNRRSLERDLPRSLSRSQRVAEPIALLYMDVDDFKRLNDRHGHAVGDETLRALGAVLRSCTRVGTDAAYRVGGDEFVMSLATDRAGAELVAQRLRRDFYLRSPQSSQLSLGVVIWDGRSTAASLLDQADGRMYQSKAASWVPRPA